MWDFIDLYYYVQLHCSTDGVSCLKNLMLRWDVFPGLLRSMTALSIKFKYALPNSLASPNADYLGSLPLMRPVRAVVPVTQRDDPQAADGL